MLRRKGLLMVVVLMLTLVFASCQSKGAYKDGTYTGVGQGKNGAIKSEVKIEKGKIAAIKFLEHKETPGLSDPVFKKMSESIIKAQKPEVDAVSGGTETSKGIINSVSDALKTAK